MYCINKDELYAALEAIRKTLSADNESIELRHLERLLKDRDEYLAIAHFSGGIPVLELAERTGVPWPQVYDIVDRVRDEKREEQPSPVRLVPAPEPSDGPEGGDAGDE